MSVDSSKAKRRQWGGIEAVVLGFLAYKVPGWFLGELVPYLNPILPHAGNLRVFILYVLFELGVIGAVFFLLRAYGVGWKQIGLGRPQYSHVIKAIGGFCAYFVLTVMVYWLVQQIITIPEEVQEIGFDAPGGLLEQILVFVALIGIVPFAEEVLFRGFLFTGIRRDFSFFTTSIVVSLLFGLAHGQLDVGIDVFVLSLVLCYLREKTNSIWPGIFVHAIKNGVAFFTLFIYNVH